MKTQALVELVTDAVTDAVREVLPRMIADALDRRVSEVIGPEVDRQARALDALQAQVQERLTDMQADFATRGTAQCDALTSSWERQVTALRESIAEQVDRAVSGVPSLPGPRGEPGPAGRDATFTPPVHWQPETNYTRGSIVMHRNGLWFANQDTAVAPGSGVDGYSLMFDGHELEGYEHDARGYQVAVYRYASGKARRVETGERPFSYCGVYDHATNYYFNDCVTAKGCMWIHKAPESCALQPGTNEARDAWQLVVKCGRDGRDGLDGVAGPKGDRGEAGPPGAAPRAPKPKANGAPV